MDHLAVAADHLAVVAVPIAMAARMTAGRMIRMTEIPIMADLVARMTTAGDLPAEADRLEVREAAVAAPPEVEVPQVVQARDLLEVADRLEAAVLEAAVRAAKDLAAIRVLPETQARVRVQTAAKMRNLGDPGAVGAPNKRKRGKPFARVVQLLCVQ